MLLHHPDLSTVSTAKSADGQTMRPAEPPPWPSDEALAPMETRFSRVEAVLRRLGTTLRAAAKANQRLSQGRGRKGSARRPAVHCRAEVAKQAGVSEHTVERVQTVLARGSEALKERARRGDISVNGAYRLVVRLNRSRGHGKPAKVAGGAPAFQILHRSAQDTGLPDRSVHCCTTSPPFWDHREGTDPEPWPEVRYAPMPGLPPLVVPAMNCCLGNEPTPEQYIGHLVHVFREVRRVLRDDGTLWVNAGDTYMTSDRVSRASGGLKPQDCGGIPWRLGFALQADGWTWRCTAPWVKRNPVPQSMKNRPGTATEQWLMLAKSPGCFYDAAATRVPVVGAKRRRNDQVGGKKYGGNRGGGYSVSPHRNRRDADWWYESLGAAPIGMVSDEQGLPLGFDFTVGQYGGAHSAAMPPSMLIPIIGASTPEAGICPTCSAPWLRLAGSDEWEQGCRCPRHDPIPATVFDPFTGSGATAIAAVSLGRRFFGTEVSGVHVDETCRRFSQRLAKYQVSDRGRPVRADAAGGDAPEVGMVTARGAASVEARRCGAGVAT